MILAALHLLGSGQIAGGSFGAYLLIYIIPGVVVLVLGAIATALSRLNKAVTLLVHEVMPPDRPSLREDVTALKTDIAVMRVTQISRGNGNGGAGP